MPKFEHAYEGPFIIKKNYSELDFLIQLDRAGKEKPVNHDKLKPYEGDHAPKWLKKARKTLLQSLQ